MPSSEIKPLIRLVPHHPLRMKAMWNKQGMSPGVTWFMST